MYRCPKCSFRAEDTAILNNHYYDMHEPRRKTVAATVRKAAAKKATAARPATKRKSATKRKATPKVTYSKRSKHGCIKPVMVGMFLIVIGGGALWV